MALKRQLDSLDGIDDAVASLYVEKDGKYVLDVDLGDVTSKLNEFRANNRELSAKLAKMQEKLERFKDVDPEKYHAAMDALEKIEGDEERQLIAKGKIDEVIQRRTEAMRRNYEEAMKAKGTALEQLQKERDALRGVTAKYKVEGALRKQIEKGGYRVRAGAMPDVLSRAYSVWCIDDKGNMVPAAGGKTVYGKDGDPLTMEEYRARLLEEAPHLFEPGEGGGAEGGERPPKGEGGVKVVPAGDPFAFGRAAEDIAKGKAVVR